MTTPNWIKAPSGLQIQSPVVGSQISSNWAAQVTDAANVALERDAKIARLERVIEVMLNHLPPEVRFEVDVLVRSD